jgi:hypothetical protein
MTRGREEGGDWDIKLNRNQIMTNDDEVELGQKMVKQNKMGKESQTKRKHAKYWETVERTNKCQRKRVMTEKKR